MKEKENFDWLIGKEIETLTDKGEVDKTITVQSWKRLSVDIDENNTKEVCMFISTDGEIYNEDELNFRYTLSEGGILLSWLLDNKALIKKIYECEKYEDVKTYELVFVIHDLFDKLIHHGILLIDDPNKVVGLVNETCRHCYEWIKKETSLQNIFNGHDSIEGVDGFTLKECLFRFMDSIPTLKLTEE